MQKDDLIELVIDGQGMDGEGVAHYEGIVVFVPYTLIGERVMCKVTFVKKNFANAKVIKLIEKSEYRATPACPVYYKCGGCDYLHIDPSRHRELKTKELVSNFKKIAGVDIALDDYVESDKSVGYRNKVQIPFGMLNGEAVLGYYANNTHEVVPCDDCLLHDEWAYKLSKIVLDFINYYQIPVYDERTGKGFLRHLVMRKVGDYVSIVLVINGERIDGVDKLIKALKACKIPFSLHYNINKRDTNVIVSDKLIKVYGDDNIDTRILGAEVTVSPLSFMQVNDYIRDKIYVKAVEELKGASVLFDLYSGIGITSNILAKHCNKVYSIEISRDAVENAKELAKRNNNANIVTVCGDCAVELPKLMEKISRETVAGGGKKDKQSMDSLNSDITANGNVGSGMKGVPYVDSLGTDSATNTNVESGKKGAQHVDSLGINSATNINKEGVKQSKIAPNSSIGSTAALLDPPRKGCDKAVIDSILKTAPDKIVYISCNHATLARDFNLLKDSYDISNISAFDMFPNTHHVEVLVCLTRK